MDSIAALTKEIGKLPKEYISKKAIAGKVYYYHQWSEKGVKQIISIRTTQQKVCQMHDFYTVDVAGGKFVKRY